MSALKTNKTRIPRLESDSGRYFKVPKCDHGAAKCRMQRGPEGLVDHKGPAEEHSWLKEQWHRDHRKILCAGHCCFLQPSAQLPGSRMKGLPDVRSACSVLVSISALI